MCQASGIKKTTGRMLMRVFKAINFNKMLDYLEKDLGLPAGDILWPDRDEHSDLFMLTFEYARDFLGFTFLDFLEEIGKMWSNTRYHGHNYTEVVYDPKDPPWTPNCDGRLTADRWKPIDWDAVIKKAQENDPEFQLYMKLQEEAALMIEQSEKLKTSMFIPQIKCGKCNRKKGCRKPNKHFSCSEEHFLSTGDLPCMMWPELSCDTCINGLRKYNP